MQIRAREEYSILYTRQGRSIRSYQVQIELHCTLSEREKGRMNGREALIVITLCIPDEQAFSNGAAFSHEIDE